MFDKNFLYGAGAVAVIWWLYRRRPCACPSVADVSSGFASQTPNSAQSTLGGTPAPIGGLLPASLTRATAPTDTNPAAQLNTSIADTAAAASAIQSVAPGPTALIPSFGSLASGAPVMFKPPAVHPQKWAIS